jgi:hypothetical protein
MEKNNPCHRNACNRMMFNVYGGKARMVICYRNSIYPSSNEDSHENQTSKDGQFVLSEYFSKRRYKNLSRSLLFLSAGFIL